MNRCLTGEPCALKGASTVRRGGIGKVLIIYLYIKKLAGILPYLEELFPQFLEFFFYDLYKEIDFSRKPVFLDKELEKLLKVSKAGKNLLMI